MQLDTPTLALVTVLGGFVFAVSMTGVWLAGTRERCVASWALAGMCSAAGYCLGVFASDPRLAIPAWVAVALANGLIGLSHALVFVGVRQFLRLPAYVGPLCILIGILFAAALVSEELRTSLRSRVLFQSPAYIVLAIATAVSLLRAAEPGQRAIQAVTALVLLGYAAFLSVRASWLFVQPGDGHALGYDPLQAAVFPVTLLFKLLLSMCIVLLLYRSKELALRALARVDPLTGLGNRAALDAQFGIQMARVRRSGEPLSAVMVDLDHFKRINDRHGHPVGDAVLRAAAQVIDADLRDSDCAFRIGGEEFLLLLPDTSVAMAQRIAERLRGRLNRQVFDTSVGAMQVSASFGVAELDVGEALSDFLDRADRALYAAKHRGRNCVVVDMPGLSHDAPAVEDPAPSSV